MAKNVLIDELHLTIRIPSNLPETQIKEIRWTLTGDDFLTRLRRAIRKVRRTFPVLGVARVSLTR